MLESKELMGLKMKEHLSGIFETAPLRHFLSALKILGNLNKLPNWRNYTSPFCSLEFFAEHLLENFNICIARHRFTSVTRLMKRAQFFIWLKTWPL